MTTSQETYEGGWHRACDRAGVLDGPLGERLLRWINLALGTAYTDLPEAQQAYATSRGAYNWSSLAETGERAPPINTPSGWQMAWGFFADRYASWDDVKRSGGNQFGGYAAGKGLFQWGTDMGSTYDMRGTGGQDQDFAPDPEYPGWSIAPVTFEDGQMVIRAGLMSALGIGSLVPYRTTNTRYTLFCSRFSTESSVQFKGDHALEIVCTMPTEIGSWAAIWGFGGGRSPANSAATCFEIDYMELVNADVNNRRVAQTNAHGHVTSGGTYETTDSWVDVGETIGGVERTWLIVREGDTLTWYMDGAEIKSTTIPSDWDAKDELIYLRFDFGVCNTPTFPGIYDGTPDVVPGYVRSVRLFMPPANIATHLVLDDQNGDPVYGPSIKTGVGVQNAYGNGYWLSSGTDSDGTPVGSLTPKRIASAGSVYNRRYYTGRAANTNSDNWSNEPGTTATHCGVEAGLTYACSFTYKYGTSNAGYISLGANANGEVQLTLAGNVATVLAGAVSNVSITTDANGWKVLTFDWVCAATGDSHVSWGPYSSTVGQDGQWLDWDVKPYL